MTRYRDRYEEIYKILTRAELQSGANDFDDLVLGPDLFGADRHRWLRFYTHDGLRIAMEKYGFYRELERMGFRELRLETRTEDPSEHLLRLWSLDPIAPEPLVELVVHRDIIFGGIPVLNVQWLRLQNPLGDWPSSRPPLPGQRYPGLGVGSQVLEMLRNVCHRLQLAGIVTTPSYFHNAVFYSSEFLHIDPYFQGTFLALCRDLIPQTSNQVAHASWALHWKMVLNSKREKKPIGWTQKPMLDPIDDRTRTFFESEDYRKEVQRALVDHDFQVLKKPLHDTLQSRGISPFNREKISTWIDQEE